MQDLFCSFLGLTIGGLRGAQILHNSLVQILHTLYGRPNSQPNTIRNPTRSRDEPNQR